MAGRVKPGIPENSQVLYPKNTRSARVAMAPYPTGTCVNCTNHGVLKYARRTMCTRYKCQKAATAERVARLADGGGDAAVPTYCSRSRSDWHALRRP